MPVQTRNQLRNANLFSEIKTNLLSWMQQRFPTYELDYFDYSVISYFIKNNKLPYGCRLPLELFEEKKYDPEHFCPSWCTCCEDNLKLKN